MTALEGWQKSKTCVKRELLSLRGCLSFACKVVKPGKMFLRRLIDLSTSFTPFHFHITMTVESRLDIQWWLDFLPTWNRVELIQPEPILARNMQLITDASGVGLSGYFMGEWFSHALVTEDNGMAFRELLVVVLTRCLHEGTAGKTFK